MWNFKKKTDRRSSHDLIDSMSLTEARQTIRMKDMILEECMKRIEELQAMVKIKDRMIASLISEVENAKKGSQMQSSLPALQRRVSEGIDPNESAEDQLSRFPDFGYLHSNVKIEIESLPEVKAKEKGESSLEGGVKVAVEQKKADQQGQEMRNGKTAKPDEISAESKKQQEEGSLSPKPELLCSW
mmetsp:Transcript_4151/g.9735  ORF Transcript_4151/g.9735 Transcript_4151/m.9735 type:complete len:186 (-) Transcript_4151:6-563(-)|eukprot:CAMPEP_0114517520 /NCGR_PEP_ID=MMETSP0109-20121206/17939_1 /TAXON_ID=29199 /ORGANISM="Chlorarachnion reptans, Strain CCCM449" /LENGTH=185 /DNA_ID=CAMNT_0001698049 /DNA_START=323 /DNA_END=880 /DNA_ORIENTATION=-